MAEYNIKFGWLTQEEIELALANDTLNAYDVVYCKDDHQQYIIKEDKTLFRVESRMPIFQSVASAEITINESDEYYVGEIISVLVDDKFVAYMIQGVPGEFTIQKVCSETDLTYDDLKNVPIKNVGTKITERVNILDLPEGYYKANYFVSPVGNEINSVVGNFFIISTDDDGKQIKRITETKIIDYSVIDGQVTTSAYANEDYVNSRGFMTEGDVDLKFEAFNVAMKEYVQNYVKTTCELLCKHLIDEELAARMATDEEIIHIFEN